MADKMKAWLITWEWTGDHAAVADKVVGFLNPRLGKERVVDIVEFLYAQRYSNLSEFAAYAKDSKNNPYRTTFEKGRIFCGRNPMLEARKVNKLDITTDPNNRLETITWEEEPLYRWRNNELELVRGPLPQKFKRRIE
jgi:hypothetical protein